MGAGTALQPDRQTLGTTHGLSRRSALRLGRRLPLVLQTEATECGLACLAMIAGYHGHHTGLMELRRRFSVSLKGISSS